MRAGRAFLVVLALAAWVPAAASPAAPEITIDKTLGKVAGWSIGYGASTGGCLAAATYGDGTTIWFGFGGGTDRAFLAFTNARWRSIEVGQSYDIRLQARGGRNWHGAFAGFQRNGQKGIFASGLKTSFVADLAEAGGLDVSLDGRRVALLSLVGSADALAAVGDCQKNAGTAEAAVPAPAAPADNAPEREQAAQVEAAAHLRADRLSRLRQTAGHAVDDAAGFIKANGDDPRILDHLQHLTDLRASLDGGEPATIESRAAALAAALNADPAYVAYRARVDVEQQRENARYLEEAIRTLRIQKDVLVRALIQDPTAPSAPEFLSLQKQAAAAIEAPELERAKTVVGLIDAAIQRGGLGASYTLARSEADKPAVSVEGRAP